MAKGRGRLFLSPKLGEMVHSTREVCCFPFMPFLLFLLFLLFLALKQTSPAFGTLS